MVSAERSLECFAFLQKNSLPFFLSFSTVSAHLGLWLTESERLFSPKETLKSESQGAANGTQRTPRYCIAGFATLELLSALRYTRLTQALYIVAHGLGDVRKVLLYGRLDGESRQ